jgi:hypothetical protein
MGRSSAACAISRLDGMLAMERTLQRGAGLAIGAHAQRGCGFPEL